MSAPGGRLPLLAAAAAAVALAAADTYIVVLALTDMMAGVGIGITLMLKAPKNPARDAIRPRFDLGLSGQKAVAKVGWVFNSF